MRTLLPFVAASVFALTLAPANADHHAPTKTDSPTFAALKKLVGTWTAQTEKMPPVTITYALTSGNRCVKETIELKDSPMETVFCDNGDAVVVTHYCHAGNQPRLKSQGLSADGKSITFDVLDATGLASPKEGHMHKLVMQLPDATKGKLVETWSYFENGAEKSLNVFTLTRKN